MAEIGPLTLSIITNTKPIEDAGRVAKDTANEIKRINVELSTFLETTLELTQRDIESTFNNIDRINNNIEATKIKIRDEQNEIESLQKQLQVKNSQLTREALEDVGDLLTLPFGGPSGNQLADIVIALDPRGLITNFKELKAIIQSIGKLEQKSTLENALETNNFPFINKPLTAEQRAEFEAEIEAIEKRLIELDETKKRLFDENLVRENPLKAEINQIREDVKNAEGIVEDNEALLKKQETNLENEQNLLKKLLKDEEEAIKQLQELGADIPAEGLKLNIEPLDPEIQKQLQEEIDNTKESIDQQSSSVDLLDGAIAMLGPGLVAGAGAQKKFSKEVAQAEKTLGGFNDETSNIDIQDKLSNIPVDTVTPEEVVPKETVERTKSVGEGLKKSSEIGKKALSSLGALAGNIAKSIANTFSGFISNAIKGDFSSIGDLWDDLTDSMLDTFADFAAKLLTDPIRIAFEATLNGEKGNIFDLISGAIGGKKDKEKSQNVINLDDFRENKQKFRLAA